MRSCDPGGTRPPRRRRRSAARAPRSHAASISARRPSQAQISSSSSHRSPSSRGQLDGPGEEVRRLVQGADRPGVAAAAVHSAAARSWRPARLRWCATSAPVAGIERGGDPVVQRRRVAQVGVDRLAQQVVPETRAGPSRRDEQTGPRRPPARRQLRLATSETGRARAGSAAGRPRPAGASSVRAAGRQQARGGAYRGAQVRRRAAAAGGQHPGALHREQRVALGGGDHLPDRPRRRPAAATRPARRRRRRLIGPTAISVSRHRPAGQVGEHGVQLRPGRPVPPGEHEQQRQPAEPPADVRDQPQAGPVGPVGVVHARAAPAGRRRPTRPAAARPRTPGAVRVRARATGGGSSGRPSRAPRPGDSRFSSAGQRRPARRRRRPERPGPRASSSQTANGVSPTDVHARADWRPARPRAAARWASSASRLVLPMPGLAGEHDDLARAARRRPARHAVEPAQLGGPAEQRAAGAASGDVGAQPGVHRAGRRRRAYPELGAQQLGESPRRDHRAGLVADPDQPLQQGPVQRPRPAGEPAAAAGLQRTAVARPPARLAPARPASASDRPAASRYAVALRRRPTRRRHRAAARRPAGRRTSSSRRVHPDRARRSQRVPRAGQTTRSAAGAPGLADRPDAPSAGWPGRLRPARPARAPAAAGPRVHAAGAARASR